MACADVTESIQHPEPREDAIGGDDVVEDGVEGRHDRLSWISTTDAITICVRIALRYHAGCPPPCPGILMFDSIARRAPLALFVFSCIALFVPARGAVAQQPRQVDRPFP